MPFFKSLLIATLLAGWSEASHAFGGGSRLTDDKFREYCWRNRRNRNAELKERPALGATLFVPTHLIDAGQIRYSFDKMLKGLEKAHRAKGNRYDKGLRQWVFGYDEGRSLFPIEKRLRGIYHPGPTGEGRIHLVDGHHRALISTYRGAPTVPMHFIGENWDHLDVPNFRRTIKTEPHHLAHWLDFTGRAVDPVDLCDMVHDPYLTLARMLIHRVDVTRDPLDPNVLRVGNHRGPDKFIVLKINDDLPFLEFEIADVLRRHGVIFTASDELLGLNKMRLMEFRRILSAEAQRPGSRLAHLFYFDRVVRAGEIDFAREITWHVADLGCEYKLVAALGDD